MALGVVEAVGRGPWTVDGGAARYALRYGLGLRYGAAAWILVAMLALALTCRSLSSLASCLAFPSWYICSIRDRPPAFFFAFPVICGPLLACSWILESFSRLHAWE